VRAHHEQVGIRMTFSPVMEVDVLIANTSGSDTHSSEGYKLIANREEVSLDSALRRPTHSNSGLS